MTIKIPSHLLRDIQAHGENAYPEEGAGLLLGSEQDGVRIVRNLLKLENAREENARHNRYLITAKDMLQGEKQAERLGLSIIGIFHSHPDHPNHPSEFDREWAIPWYSYLITNVQNGQALESSCWRLKDDRSGFSPEEIITSLAEK
ncbi:MAG: M67 family metallopeptidase [Anaerolineales bacterium]|nr:M67 family metallopeptidase [Anaerolineales bacterium]